MEFILYFLIVGSALMYFILKFDTHQNKRMRKLYKENEDLKPLFLERSTEQKLKTLNTKLYGKAVPELHDTETVRAQLNGSPKGLVARQLGELITDYNDGKINIKNYNTRLNEMLHQVSEPKKAHSQYRTNH